MSADADVPTVDGRTQRRTRNIDAVVDAVIELAGNGNHDPTSEEIAAVAGISHRSIYRYFDTRTQLIEAAVDRAFATASAEVFGSRPVDGSFEERVERFVSARIEIAARLRSIVRVARAHAATASEGVERARAALRSRLADDFASEFESLGPDQLSIALPAVDVAFQFEALEYLSTSAGMSDDAIRQSLALHLRRHLAVA